MNRCANCQHFAVPQDPRDSLGRRGVGLCQLLSKVDRGEFPSALMKCDYNQGVAKLFEFAVPPDFGCTLWEAKT